MAERVIMNKIYSYFKPKSLTWWAGIAAISIGCTQLLCTPCGNMTGLGTVVSAILGGADGSPVGLIIMGSGLVGIRGKLGRMS